MSAICRPAFVGCALAAAAAALHAQGDAHSSTNPVPVSASALFGVTVVNTQGERRGTVRDLAVDVVNGSVAYAIVDARDPSGLKTSVKAVPREALRPGLARGNVVLADGNPTLDIDERTARLVRASTLVGMGIDHPTGADYGVIRDLVVDFRNGRVQHAVVRLEAAPEGVTREVPFGALRFPAGSGRATLTLG